jgi:Bacterial PH domain
MTIQSHGHEHELEPQYGLPERLPAGERLLWQGSPDFACTALRVFHLRKAAIYFAALMLLRAGFVVADGGSLADGLYALAWPLPLALTALASLAALAWMTARTAVYTLTDKRVVMRIGIALTLTFNLPLKRIRAAALRQDGARSGDIVIELNGPDHIAWLHLYPHTRPWHLARPQPMLRALVDAPEVAALLRQAWAAATGAVDRPAAAPAATAVSAVTPVPPTAADPSTSRAQGAWQPSLT